METITAKKDVCTVVTDWLINQLEQGIVPWRHSWIETGLPQNLITRQPYRGINAWYLASRGYQKNFFLSPYQIKERGLKIKKGEKVHIIFPWNSLLPFAGSLDALESIGLGSLIETEQVYNISQCSGILESNVMPIKRNVYPLFAVEEIIRGMPCKPEIRHREQKPYYHPLYDFINMPIIESYDDTLSYYSSLLYELVHSTGHVSRLNRKELLDMQPYGSEHYSTEELIVDIAVQYLQCYVGIATQEYRFNHAYIKGWTERLRNQPYLIFYASAQAQRAIDYILNLSYEEMEE